MERNALASGGLQPGQAPMRHARAQHPYLARGEQQQCRALASSQSPSRGSMTAARQQRRGQRQQRQRQRAGPSAAAAAAAASLTPTLDAAPRTESPLHRLDLFDDIALARYDPSSSDQVDVVIVGAGPSGLAVADRVSAAGFRVVLVDPNPTAPWINNYGVWIDEFEAMGLDHCFDYVWPKAVVHLDSGPDGPRDLYRPYARVDRPKLKRALLERCAEQGVLFHRAYVVGATHMLGRSTVACADGTRIAASLACDASGHSQALVEYDRPFNPGFQGAYGITATVESHPFDLEAMLFMDWRDDYLDGLPDMKARNQKLPTFLYAMPFSPTKVFLEETSLVARPIIPFPELKARLEARMAHLGIKVVSIEEEEFCSIPMGGVLPRMPQRVVGVGGTAGMVHPSTGYMVSRVLGAAPLVADTIIDQLSGVADRARDAHLAPAPRDDREAAAMAAAVWAAMWPVQRLRQREFFDFGMEVLLTLDLAQTREFFAAFFALSDYHWQGFLSSRLTFGQLIGFGLSLFAKSSNQARVNLLQKGLPGLLVMLANLAKTL